MIINIKPFLKSPDVLSILAESVYMPSKEKLIKRANMYINSINTVAYGYKDNDVIFGLIVLDISNKEEIVILDIAVNKSKQCNGIGRKLIDYALYDLKPKILIAETDDEAVEFYRKCGFIVRNLGEKYPNVVRYECRYFI